MITHKSGQFSHSSYQCGNVTVYKHGHSNGAQVTPKTELAYDAGKARPYPVNEEDLSERLITSFLTDFAISAISPNGSILIDCLQDLLDLNESDSVAFHCLCLYVSDPTAGTRSMAEQIGCGFKTVSRRMNKLENGGGWMARLVLGWRENKSGRKK